MPPGRLISENRINRIGAAPGTLSEMIDDFVVRQKFAGLNYNESTLEEEEFTSIAESFHFFEKQSSVTWLQIGDASDHKLLNEIGKNYGIHSLALEDIQNTDQRPKLEIFDDYIFIVLRILKLNEDAKTLKSEQVSLILGPNYVISFTENPCKLFDPVKERIRKSSGRIRRMGSDYLAYALIDTVVDYYFLAIEQFGETLEQMEESLMEKLEDEQETLKNIHKLKREMIYARKSIWPLREVISGMQKAESGLIKESTEIFLKDVYDHTVQIMDTLESYRDMLSAMLDVYLSSTSNKMNSVMKVLTVITTIFIPLTFIAGIYGMNFKNMPELNWQWGYYGVWLLNLVLAGIMIYLFKKKKWL
jgi:magnesium transporter